MSNRAAATDAPVGVQVPGTVESHTNRRIKLFVCWSGRRGKKVAELMQDWLENRVFTKDSAEVRVSTSIEKGAPWFHELDSIVAGSDAGVLCLTPEAVRSPWVNYEAGMLTRTFDPNSCPSQQGLGNARVFTLLLGMDSSELNGPLAAFQSTLATDERDMSRLVNGLARGIDNESEGTEWRDAGAARLKAAWPALQNQLALLPAAYLPEICPELELSFRRKTFEEPLLECIGQHWLQRFCGAHDTCAALREKKSAVIRACRGYVADLFQRLESEVDRYAMALSLLLNCPPFPIAADGRLAVAKEHDGIVKACEIHRHRVLYLVDRLVHRLQAPFFDEAVPFDDAEDFGEHHILVQRKKRFVAEVSNRLQKDCLPNEWPEESFCFDLVHRSITRNVAPHESDDQRKIDLDLHWQTSPWPFDRIMYALFLEHRLQKGWVCVKAFTPLIEQELALLRVAPAGSRERQVAARLLQCVFGVLIRSERKCESSQLRALLPLAEDAANLFRYPEEQFAHDIAGQLLKLLGGKAPLTPVACNAMPQPGLGGPS